MLRVSSAGDGVMRSRELTSWQSAAMHRRSSADCMFQACLKWILLLLAIHVLAASTSAAPRRFTVLYVSADYAYLDGGVADSLALGDTLRVPASPDARNPADVSTAVMVVEHVADHSAACRIIVGRGPIVAGNLVLSSRREPREGAPAPSPVVAHGESVEPAVRGGAEGAERAEPPRPPWAELSGYAAFQWYRFEDDGPSRVRRDQPTLRFSVKARRIRGKELSFYAKGRARHDIRRSDRTTVSVDEWSNRLYAFALSYGAPDARLNWQIGRLLSSALAPTGPVDGALVEGRVVSVMRAGGFGGTIPDDRTRVGSSSYLKYGLFIRATKGQFGAPRWSAVAAATAEYHRSTVSRQYVYQQADWQSGRRWSIYEGIEIDLNNGWRREGSLGAVSLTNARMSVACRPTDRTSVTMSYDNRRNYRTWETRSVADSLFDTAFRNGLRTNAHVNLGRDWSISANAGGQRRQGESATTWSWGGGASCGNFVIRRLYLSAQLSGFSGPWASGLNPSLNLRQSFLGGHQVGIAAGAYIYESGTPSTRRESRWARVDVTRYLTSRFYINGQFEHDWGDEPRGNRMQAETGISF